MAVCCILLPRIQAKVLPGCPRASITSNIRRVDLRYHTRRKETQYPRGLIHRVCCSIGISAPSLDISPLNARLSDDTFYGQTKITNILSSSTGEMQDAATTFKRPLMVVLDLDPGTAKVAIGIVGAFLSGFSFLFILRIVMSWYPKLPVGEFPYVIAYAPTEPLLIPTRRLIPPLGGVDVTPIVWFGLISFLNEILVGPQGLLVLLSQQVS